MTKQETEKEFEKRYHNVQGAILVSYDFALEMVYKIYDQHDAELNELKNRTCEGCKYYNETGEVHKNSCRNIMGITLRPISGLPRDFNCKYWVKKDVK